MALRVDTGAILQAYELIRSRSEWIVVEGAGGWLAPIGPASPGTNGPTMQDIALALGLPVLLVVGIRLGALSHALLTADAIRRSGLPYCGLGCKLPGSRLCRHGTVHRINRIAAARAPALEKLKPSAPVPGNRRRLNCRVSEVTA